MLILIVSCVEKQKRKDLVEAKRRVRAFEIANYFIENEIESI